MSTHSDPGNEIFISVLNPLETSTTRSIRFWILLPCSVCSLACCIVLLYFLLNFQKLRCALNNHVIIVLIILEFFYMIVDIPLYLNFLRFTYVWPQQPAICLIWWVSNNGIHETITILVAWATFERHILVIDRQWVSTKARRICFHYIPIGMILLYSTLLYGLIIFFPPCQHHFEYTKEWCSEPCIFNNSIFYVYQLVVNEILFTVLIALFSLTLLVRIVVQKRTRLHQSIRWRKHRKMAIQLFAISAPYICFHLPEMIVSLAKPFDINSPTSMAFELVMGFLSYFAEILLPFTCLAALYPKPWNRRHRSVGDVTMTLSNQVRRPKTKHQDDND